MVLRPCKDCGTLAPGTRCTPCRLSRQRARDQQRGTARQRGYDTEHDKTRARLLPLAYGHPCPRCGTLMEEGQELDLGHTVALRNDPGSRGDRIEHALCNRGQR